MRIWRWEVSHFFWNAFHSTCFLRAGDLLTVRERAFVCTLLPTRTGSLKGNNPTCWLLRGRAHLDPHTQALVYQNYLPTIFNWCLCSCCLVCVWQLIAQIEEATLETEGLLRIPGVATRVKVKRLVLPRFSISQNLPACADFNLSCKYVSTPGCYENLQNEKVKSLYRGNWVALARRQMVSSRAVLGRRREVKFEGQSRLLFKFSCAKISLILGMSFPAFCFFPETA